ncbi:MAG: acyltransferase family protein [Actinobacteria bacterium]|nr:acyltransferase family protein [Actinomycetota bacterium]
MALIAVITYHFNTEWLPGAYWSIDFFFVLSGFLITALLLKEFERKDRVDLVAFWGRRFRRLMPVALLVICAVAVWALLINDPLVSRQVRGDGLGAMTYVLNLKYVVTGSSYFESFLTPSPLRHMWSLSLEEQWYAVWPLALWAVLGRGGIRAAKRAVPVLLSLAAAGAILMAYLVHDAADPSRVYYGSDTRSQALFVGAALGIWAHHRAFDSGSARRRLDAAALVSGTLCVWMVFKTSDQDLTWYRGGFIAFSLLASPLILAVAQPTPGIVHKIVDHQPFRWLGQLTYGIYLWHWPIDVAFKRLEIRGKLPVSGFALFVFQTSIILIVSAVSFYLVERPIRDNRWPIPRPKLTTSVVFAVVIALLMGLTRPSVGSGISLSAVTPGPKDVGQDGSPASVPHGGDPTLDLSESISKPAPQPAPDAPGPISVDKKPTILWVGDSTAWVMASMFQGPGIKALDGSMPGCGLDLAPMLLGNTLRERDVGCPNWQTRWAEHVSENPDLVVIAQGFHATFDVQVDGRRIVVGSPEWRARYHDQLQTGIDLVKAADARIAMLTYPCSEWRGTKTGGEEHERARAAAVNDEIRAVAAENPGWVSVVDWASFLCPKGTMVEEIEGVEMRPDGAHLLESSAPIAFRWLAPRLLEVARRPAA